MEKRIFFLLFFILLYAAGITYLARYQSESHFSPKATFFIQRKTDLKKEVANTMPRHLPRKIAHTNTKNTTPSEKIPFVFVRTPLKTNHVDWTSTTQAANDFAKNLPKAQKPTLIVIFTDVGLDLPMTKKALESLPETLTLAFSGYAQNLAHQMRQARQRGFENALMMPLETMDYPHTDSGNKALYLNESPQMHTQKIANLYQNQPPFIGFISNQDSPIEKSNTLRANMIQTLGKKGFLYAGREVLNEKNIFKIDLTLDDFLSVDQIQTFIQTAYQIAHENGVAILSLPLSYNAIEQIAQQYIQKPADIQWLPLGTFAKEPH